MKYRDFTTTIMDDNWNIATDKNGMCSGERIEVTIEEAKELTSKAVKVKRMRYGWEVYVDYKGTKKSIFLRFGNKTTRSKDSIEDFIVKNWSE